ncbi:MAG: DeoR/GlpR family DNA-binding transcription regulator [Opitutales bacterium]
MAVHDGAITHQLHGQTIASLGGGVIAQKAARLLRAGDVVLIDGGTTTCHLCFCLPPLPLRIITNSLRVAAYLDNASARRPDLEVFLSGGRIDMGSKMLSGSGTVHTLDFYHANWAFLSVGGITAGSLYNTSEPVVGTERKMIERSGRAVVLADQSRLGTRSMCRVCGVSEIDHVITDPHSGRRNLAEEAIREAGCEILYAEV